jgi:hypothetical protein
LAPSGVDLFDVSEEPSKKNFPESVSRKSFPTIETVRYRGNTSTE